MLSVRPPPHDRSPLHSATRRKDQVRQRNPAGVLVWRWRWTASEPAFAIVARVAPSAGRPTQTCVRAGGRVVIGHAVPEEGADALGPRRLGLLTSAGQELSGVQALVLALQQATAELGGLGGLAHWRDPRSGLLHLVTTCGLAPTACDPWAVLLEDGSAAPARAVSLGGFVWAPGEGRTVGVAGVAAVPLPGDRGPVGALSVITAGHSEPSTAQKTFLGSVAEWAGGRLERDTTPATDAGYEAALVLVHAVSDAFLVVDDAWRISYADEGAERLLASGGPLLGRGLWDVSAARVPGLEGQCRRASAENRAVGFDRHWPGDRRHWRVRAVPVGNGGLTVAFSDVTNQRQEEAQRATTGQTEAELASRMSELTMALSEAVTSKDVVRAVADHVLPTFGADGLAVEAIEGGHIRVVDAVGYDEEFLRHIDRIPLSANSAATDVLRTRTPRFVESPEEFVRIYPDVKHLATLSPKNAWAFLPFIASGHLIGCGVVSFSQPHSFSEEERVLLTALSGLVAQALERARLYDAEHSRAQGLQRGLLPRSLPPLPSVSASARYLPAGSGDEVGGDWYDVITLSCGRVAMVIGDVMGHGITEAATMGRLRTAVRTLADLDMDPEELLGQLNGLVADLGYDYYATCLYAVFDPVTRICSFSVAGHPPPLVVHPDGTVRCPDVTVNPPLGAAEPPFDTYELQLPEESLLVFCTDGLVESATRDIDQGLTELRHALADTVTRMSYFSCERSDGGANRLDSLCDAVVSALLPDSDQTTDDAALLVVHTRSTPAGDVASLQLAEDPRAAAEAREYIRRQLALWDLDDLVMTTELVASELVGNVVRHAKGPIRLRLLRSRSLICEVYDGSLTSPRIRRAGAGDEGGRGLQLVAAVSQRWGTRFLGDGKCIWAEQELPPERDG
ncbi:SpoIIE family protein phosphatase [Streptomyces sp. UG1]|uniref:ATP-binding SpoIIE family protein phosphatase n=1 Tax=Streptomyces sp. UG1 TaxID=3417652 RepID=UPI003CED5034